MEQFGKPVNERLEELDRIVKATLQMDRPKKLDISNTEKAFAYKSDRELQKAAFLFKYMNNGWLVNFGSKLTILAIRLRIPFINSLIKNTIFEQFVGGTSLFECQKTINRLIDYNVNSALDYGAEAKASEEDFNITMNENIRAIEFAANNESVPVISIKITGLARFGLLEIMQQTDVLDDELQKEYKNVVKRLDTISHIAAQKGVSVFFDAEESWIQDPLDRLITFMMERYNKERVVVYNTFQMYRKDRLQFLIDSFNRAKEGNYLLGAKLVRGAYMEKERERAKTLGYSSPIFETKEAVDDSYNTALRFCVDNNEHISLYNASHNHESVHFLVELIKQKGLKNNHPHINFSQLYGMSDHLSFNLAESGFNVAKLIPYGPVTDVIPYLIRRAQENTAVTGEVSREYELIQKELIRRGLK